MRVLIEGATWKARGIPVAASAEDQEIGSIGQNPTDAFLNGWWKVLHPSSQACWEETGSRKSQASPVSLGFLLAIRVALQEKN